MSEPRKQLKGMLADWLRYRAFRLELRAYKLDPTGPPPGSPVRKTWGR